jgi:hypothetical protein
MTAVTAGVAKVAITPMLGFPLVGYGNRLQGATYVHDELSARALVIDVDGTCMVLVSVEMCYLSMSTVHVVRTRIHAELGIPVAHVMIATTHTHAGPRDRDTHNWTRPLPDLIFDAVQAAYASRQPAQIGSGVGVLYGYSINRRWLDRPVDPGVTVLRVDDAAGNLLGVWCNFGCHAVVLGADTLAISGDWPGHMMAQVEAAHPDAVCLFGQGGAGDINPLVAGVRARMRSGHPVTSIGDISHNYGVADDPQAWSIGDRAGGTFAEVAELGDAVAAEVLHLCDTITTTPTVPALWATQLVVDATAAVDDYPQRVKPPLQEDLPEIVDEQAIAIEVQLMHIGDLMLVTQPGEVFAETAWMLKAQLRSMGYVTPVLVSYANGWMAYLPEPSAFPEGGYEVDWAVSLNISAQFQLRVRAAVAPVLQARMPQY